MNRNEAATRRAKLHLQKVMAAPKADSFDVTAEALKQGYRFKVEPAEYATWKMSPRLVPTIIVPPEDMEREFDSPADKLKFFFDPFYGLFPHERNEAVMARDIITRSEDGRNTLFRSYPKLNTKKLARQLATIPTMTLDELKVLARTDPTEFHDLLGSAGGIAHEVLVSTDRKAYYKFLDAHS